MINLPHCKDLPLFKEGDNVETCDRPGSVCETCVELYKERENTYRAINRMLDDIVKGE